MQFLSMITCIGFIVSSSTHALLLLNYNIPSTVTAIALNIGLVTCVLLRLWLSGIFLHERCWFRCLYKVPFWLKTCTYLCVAYGIGSALVFLTVMYLNLSTAMKEIEYITAVRFLFLGVFSLLLACFSHEFMLSIAVLCKNSSDSQIE